jgi:protein-tyrosine phosphatase
VKLLIVCLGNICRSPMGEGALRYRVAASTLAGRVEVDSAGTGDWHIGQPPDRRAIACADNHGVDISGLRARQVQKVDFERFDWLLCADQSNLKDLQQLVPVALRAKISLWLPWAGLSGSGEIPDPYVGSMGDFERVWRMVDCAAIRTIERLMRHQE